MLSLSREPANKKASLVSSEAFLFTEGEGFEPPVPYGTVVFKTTALSHSAIPPKPAHSCPKDIPCPEFLVACNKPIQILQRAEELFILK